MPYTFLFNLYNILVMGCFHSSGVKTEVSQLMYIKAGFWSRGGLDLMFIHFQLSHAKVLIEFPVWRRLVELVLYSME